MNAIKVLRISLDNYLCQKYINILILDTEYKGKLNFNVTQTGETVVHKK